MSGTAKKTEQTEQTEHSSQDTIQADETRPSTPTQSFEQQSEAQAEAFKRGDYYEQSKHGETDSTAQAAESKAQDSTDNDQAPSGQAAEGDSKTLKRVDHKIPYDRFRDVNEKAKALQQQNEELTRRLEEAQQETTTDELEDKLDTLEDQRDQAMMEGDTDKVKELRREIRQVNKQIAKQGVEVASQQTAIQSQEEILLAETAGKLMEEYPVFDKSANSFNQELVDEVSKLQSGMMAAGYNSPQALQEAVDVVAQRYGLTPTSMVSQEQANRKQQAIKRNLEVASQQPPASNNFGNASDNDGLNAIDPMRMSEDDFERLTPQQLAKLRGDYYQ